MRSRRTRVLKIDGDLDGSEIDIPGNADTDLIEPSVGTSTAERRDVLELYDRRIESPVDMAHWAQVRKHYAEEDLFLAQDWVKECVNKHERGEGAPLEELPDLGHVHIETLNSEQKYVVEKLVAHYENIKTALRNGLKISDPKGLIVYGLGGTGKSHVLRAFKQAIDDDSEPLLTTDVDDSASARVLTSDDFVVVMAPSAVAAINVRGDTLQGACAFPRTVGKRCPKVEDFDDFARRADVQRKHKYAQFYFIDEVGMVGAGQLGGIGIRLNQVHSATGKNVEFGGKNVILFGHHAQLPPAGDKRLFRQPKAKEHLSDLQVCLLFVIVITSHLKL